MNKVIHGSGVTKSVSWHAETAYLVAPKIFKRTVTIDGIVYYRGEKGRMFIKELFDKMFKRGI